jgi:hypothetical protein
MRIGLKWGDSSPVSYDIVYKNYTSNFYNESCFSSLPRNCEDIKYIIIYDIECDVTKDYTDFYIQYIIDMYKLEATFENNIFKFKAFDNRYKNMLICATIRILWENIGDISPTLDTVTYLFELLKNGKCIYKDKLKRFCYFYSKIPYNGNYWNTGHSWNPNLTKIKSTKDFVNTLKLNSVNGFFEK